MEEKGTLEFISFIILIIYLLFTFEDKILSYFTDDPSTKAILSFTILAILLLPCIYFGLMYLKNTISTQYEISGAKSQEDKKEQE